MQCTVTGTDHARVCSSLLFAALFTVFRDDLSRDGLVDDSPLVHDKRVGGNWNRYRIGFCTPNLIAEFTATVLTNHFKVSHP